MVTQVRADDLTAIRGIGASRQRWLAQEFGVRTYTQLAALSADVIEARLKSAGKLSSRAEIEGWLAQAAQMTAATPTPAEQEWTPAATFVVEFQQHKGAADRSAWRTVVHYLEADLGQTWPDVEMDGVGDWLRQRVTALQPEPPAAQPVPVVAPAPRQASVVAAPVGLRVRQVRVSQPPAYATTLDVTQPAPPLLGHVGHEAPLTFEVELEPVNDGPATAVPDYTARFQVHNLSRSGKPAWLDMQPGPAADGDTTYRARLSDLHLEPGLYGLSIVISHAEPAGAIHLRLPKLNVL